MEIKFENVSFIIDKGTPLEKTILNDVSFKLRENKIYGILGNSNSGKTCIAELIDALIKPTKGKVCVNDFVNDGHRIKKVNKLRLNIGYVFKNPYDMFFNKTVKKELVFGMKYFKYKLERVKFRPIDALKLVGLDESYLNKNPMELTLSEARKVAFASVIIFNPKVIILDEPTIGFSYNDKKELIRLIKILKNKYKRMIIILSKDTDFLYSLVDYVYLFDKSRLITEGETELFKERALLETLGLKVPDIIKFISLAKSKNVKLYDYKDIKDLIKGVCNNVF